MGYYSRYIRDLLFQIKEGIDRAREAGVPCGYPDSVIVEMQSAGTAGYTTLVVPFSVKEEVTQEKRRPEIPAFDGDVEFERGMGGDWGIKGLRTAHSDYDLCRYCAEYSDCGEKDIFRGIRTATGIGLVVWTCPHFEEAK